VQQVVPRWALLALALQQAQTGESELPQAQSSPAQQASRPVVPQQVKELVPCVAREQPLRALPV